MSDIRFNLLTAMASKDVVVVSDILHAYPELLVTAGIESSCIFNALNSSIEVVQACLYARPEALLERFVGGETVLIRAVIEHSPAFQLILERLLKQGHSEELLVVDKYGHEVMYYAYAQGNAEMVSMLWTALHSTGHHASAVERFNRPLATGICLMAPLMNDLNHTDDMTQRLKIMLQWGANGIGSPPPYFPDHSSVRMLVACVGNAEMQAALLMTPAEIAEYTSSIPQMEPVRPSLCACL